MFNRRNDTLVRGDDFGLVHCHIADMRGQIIFEAGGKVLCQGGDDKNRNDQNKQKDA
ncbi:hypothetical protein SDC9_133125 [bioreactor metagenome]|uniref:Uncharacterized protein n=1 Tax=bioreactor metagenome TaxID=1076179 RepID=A0A645DBU1_9ZZZZ